MACCKPRTPVLQIGARLAMRRPKPVRRPGGNVADDGQAPFRGSERTHQPGVSQFTGAGLREEPARALGELVRSHGSCRTRGFRSAKKAPRACADEARRARNARRRARVALTAQTRRVNDSRPAALDASGRGVPMTVLTVASRALAGIDAPEVTVEVHLGPGLPAFHIVGLPATGVRAARHR